MYVNLDEASSYLNSAGTTVSRNQLLRLGVAGRVILCVPLFKSRVYSPTLRDKLTSEAKQALRKDGLIV